jgi:hypothetical protein
MYGYLVSAILIFMTHPGVAYNFFDPGVPGALFQCVAVIVLSLPSTGGAGFAGTMSFLYWLMLGLWAYIKVRMTLAGK